MSVSVFAPASIGNIGIGFDIMGMAIERPGDEVVARLSDTPGLRITRITGMSGQLPLDVHKNTAGVAALRLLEYLDMQGRGIEIELHKKMPSGSGLGSSAASAVAAALAVSELLQTGMSKLELLPFACAGEQIASGGFHADNVAPSLLGGIVLIRDHGGLDVQSLPVPADLYVTVVYPHVEVLTKTARAILKPTVDLTQYIRQSANIGAFVVGLYENDLPLIGRALDDIIIEPQRAALIPGFYDVKNAALDNGALGASISGSGPSVFGLFPDGDSAEKAGAAMQAAFSSHGIMSEIFCSPVNTVGAERVQ